MIRDPRLLVPTDVQAFVAAPGGTEPVVRMLSALRAGAGQPAFPAPFDPGSPREPGVHLHWALPDALMRGRIGVLKRLGTPDGIADIEQREHALAFTSAPSGEVSVDRLLVGQAGVAGTVGSRGRTAARLRAEAAVTAATPAAAAPAAGISARLVWAKALLPEASAAAVSLADRGRMQAVENAGVPPAQVITPAPQVVEVSRPGPRWFTPLLPVLAVSGAGRSLRHGGDGRFSPDGALQCRWPSQVQQGANSVVSPQRAVPALGSAAVPPELLALAREALITSPYAVEWLSAAAPSHTGTVATLAQQRLLAEAALRYGANAAYTATTTLFSDPATASPDTVESRLVGQELRRFSLFNGVDADPVGVTAWTQPWIPLWLEWQVEIDNGGAVGGWQLGGVDLVPLSPPAAATTLVCTGRSVLAPGPATGLSTALARWLDDEHQRDLAGVGQIDDATYAMLSRVRDLAGQLDVVSAALEGLREQLLGLPWDNGLVRTPDGSVTAAGLPQLLLPPAAADQGAARRRVRPTVRPARRHSAGAHPGSRPGRRDGRRAATTAAGAVAGHVPARRRRRDR